jgi:hypothetical protein
MNSPDLAPETRGQLAAFARRWTVLTWLRGLCAGGAILLGGFTLVGLADGWTILAEDTRWLLSGTVYLGALLAWLLLTGLNLYRPLDERELAKRLEKSWPGLQGKLLSAVELADPQEEGKWDSPAFRGELQEDVANRVRDLDMRRVLPQRTIQTWWRGFVAAAAVTLLLLVLPGLHFGNLFARAALPILDIHRPSRVQLTLITPSPDTQWVPVGDDLEVVVELKGPRPDEVVLEVFGQGGKRGRITMAMWGSPNFSASFRVAPIRRSSVSLRATARPEQSPFPRGPARM